MKYTVVYQPKYSRYRTEVTVTDGAPSVRMFLIRNGVEHEMSVKQTKL